MQRVDMDRLDRHTKWWLLIVSLLTIGCLAAAALRENVHAEWRQTRLGYARILKQMAGDEHGRQVADQFEVRIVQNVVADLGRTDRCITCHAGVDDPRMQDQPQPFTTHPGAYLRIHPPSETGCTICHQGQGLATEKDDAHGHAPFWDYPILEKAYLSTTCTRCHDRGDLEGPDGLFERMQRSLGVASGTSTDYLALGRELVQAKGCLGCHTLNGKGGTIGPDISAVGDKTHHEFDFSRLGHDAPHTIEYWLEQHFMDPGRVSPNTVMPAAAVSRKEARALTAYMRSLRRGAPSAFERPNSSRVAEERDGHELYGMYCAACHGPDGVSPDLPHIRTPSLNNVDTLATASDDYFRQIIMHGRLGTMMPAWGEGAGGLSREEIDRIVAHIREWEPEGAHAADVSAARGNPARGRAYYRGFCAGCHGLKGEGGIGNALNVPSFLAIATDDFLAETIIEGRPGTAMASWRHWPAQAVSDVLAAIRAWAPAPPSFDAVAAQLAHGPRAARAAAGRAVYRGRCASCHGDNGQGGIGLRLSTPELLALADDRFLYRTITEGRPSTAMPAWPQLSAEQVAGLITYLRTLQTGLAIVPERLSRRGDYAVGQTLYEISCIGCHGPDARGGSGPQLANPVLLSSASDEMLYHWIAHGRTGTAMKGFVSGEQGVTELRPGQILDIIAYLRQAGARPQRPVLRIGKGDPHLGGQLYQGTCASCHGTHGEGGSGPQLNNPTFLRAASDGFLEATMVLGRTGTPMRSMVHGQEGLGQIEPSQVDDVVAFLRQWEFPETWRLPRSLAEVNHRSLVSGRDQFGRYCAACHGPNGLGDREGLAYFAPSLNNSDFLRAASDGFLLATIARGRSGTPMRPFGVGAGGIAELDGAAINDIVSYVRSWEAMDESERRGLIATEKTD